MLSLQGPKQPVQAVAFAPDGRTLASAGNDKSIRLWELATGKELQRWRAHRHAVLCLAFAPDGKTLASGSFDQTVKVWDVPGGEEQITLAGAAPVVTSVAFTANGKTLAASFGDRLVFDSEGGARWWDVATWQLRGALTPAGEEARGTAPEDAEALYEVNYGGIQTAAYTRDGRVLALATTTVGVVLWDVLGNRERVAFPQNSCRALALAPDDRLLAAADARAIHLWDVLRGTKRATLEGHTGLVWSVAFSPDGALLLSGAKDGSVRLWDVASGKVRAAFDWDVDTIHQVAFAPDGMTAAVAGHTGAVIVWDVDPDESPRERGVGAGTVVALPAVPPVRKGRGWLRLQHEKAVHAVTFSPDGKLLASLAFRDVVRLWEREGGRERCTLPKKLSSDTGYGLAFAPDGQTLAVSGGVGASVDLWDLRTEEVRARFRPKTFAAGGNVAVLAFAPGGEYLAWGLKKLHHLQPTPKLSMRSAREGGTQAIALMGRGGLLALAFSPDGTALACAAADRSVLLWDVAKKWERKTSFETRGKCLALAYAPDGRTLAGAVGRKILFWDPETGKLRATLQGHTAEVRALAFAPDGGTLLSGGKDGTVRLWDAASCAERAAHDWKIGRVKSVAFAPDGKAAAAGGDQGEVVLWELGDT